MHQRGHNVAATCALLKRLLTEHPTYQRRWRAYSERTSGRLNQAAVAKVIQLYLWETGETSDTTGSIARTLKDRVSRALNGKGLSPKTLTWIIGSFDMSQRDRDHLWEVLSGEEESESEISHTLRSRREMLRRQCHRTVNLVERYAVNNRRRLTSRHTKHTIRAIEDGVDIYLFNHERQASRIDVKHGGNIGRSYEYGDGLCGIEIMLDRSLVKNETTALDYSTQFDKDTAQLTEVRRAAFARVENIDLAVVFEGAAPRHAWWCVWDDHLDGEPVTERQVEITRGSIRQFVRSIEETVIGFRWTW